MLHPWWWEPGGVASVGERRYDQDCELMVVVPLGFLIPL